MLSRCNFNNIDVITDIGTVGNIFFGNFATTQMIMNKDTFYLLQNNSNQNFECKYLYVQTSLYLIQNNTKQKFLVFKAQSLYCHELILCKWVNLQRPRH